VIVHSWYQFGVAATGGLLAGLVIYFLIHLYVKKYALRTAWQGDELILNAIAKSVPLLGILVGILWGLPLAPFMPKLVLGLQKGVGFGIIFSITYVVANIASGLIQLAAGGRLGMASTSIFRVLAKLGIWALGTAMMLKQLGIPIAPILAALGVVGLAVAIALQDTLSNLFAGIHIIMSRQLKIGDLIKLETGTEGVVEDINWRNTTVRAPANNLVVIPNSKLLTTIVTNNALPEPETNLIIPIVVGFNNDLTSVERVTLEVARDVLATVDGGVANSTPIVRFSSLVGSARFTVTLRARDYRTQFVLRHEFLKRLHQRFIVESINFPDPLLKPPHAKT